MREIFNNNIVEQYIGKHHQKDFNDFCNRPLKTLLINGFTGIGKTYAIVKYAEANPNKKIVLACPTQSLVDNIKNDLAYKSIARVCGYGSRFAESMYNENFVVTTYDTALKMYGVDIVFIDEAHLIAGHAGFRNAVINLMRLNCKSIMITATPEVIIDLPHFRDINETVIGFTRLEYAKDVTIVKSKKRAKTLIHEVIEKTRNSNKTILIRVNNKNYIDEVFNIYKGNLNGRKIAKIYSDDNNVLTVDQTEEDVNKLKQGDLRGFDIVLCTSIYDAGLSFKVDRDVECYAISQSNKIMPNPINMVQLFARVRTNTGFDMSLTITGNFGEYGGNYSELPDVDTRLLSQEMDLRYTRLCELTEERYSATLLHYNLKTIIKEDFKIDGGARYSASKSSKSDLIANLRINNPELYSNIKLNAESRGQQAQLRFFEGDKIIVSKGSNATILREVNKINKALESDIVPEIYFSETLVGFDTLSDASKPVYEYKYKPKTCDTIQLVYDKINYGTDTTFINLVKGLAYINGDKFNYKELDLGMLNKSDAKTIKSLYNMMYKTEKFRRSSASKVFKEGINKESEIVKLINNLVS